MFVPSSELMTRLEEGPNEEWVRSHIAELTNLLPDFAAMYSRDHFRALVIRMLLRADAAGLREHDATVAFCYTSVKLGMGFEDEADHQWFDAALLNPEYTWADNIWHGLQRAIAARPRSAT